MRSPIRTSTKDDVEHLYGSSFERAPDAGARCWQQRADAQRFPLERVLQNVASSPEHVRGIGGSRATVVARGYDEVFEQGGDRTPSRGEVSSWSGRIEALVASTPEHADLNG